MAEKVCECCGADTLPGNKWCGLCAGNKQCSSCKGCETCCDCDEIPDPKKRRYYVEGPGINSELEFDSYNEACVFIAKLPTEIEKTARVVPRKKGRLHRNGY